MGEGFLKLVTVRGQGNQEVRTLLAMREHPALAPWSLCPYYSAIDYPERFRRGEDVDGYPCLLLLVF